MVVSHHSVAPGKTALKALILRGMVGDPGIEPGTSRLGGVTVRCRTLQHVAHWRAEYARGQGASRRKFPLARRDLPGEGGGPDLPSPGRGAMVRAPTGARRDGGADVKKPTWVVDKERARRAAAAETVWLFGLHAVRDALTNPARAKLRLVLTRNAADRLADAVAAAGMEPEIVEPRKFDAHVPLDPENVHQGAALEVRPLGWGSLADLAVSGAGAPLVVLLDRVTDPHNVGAVLRSAEVFGARAVIAPLRHSAPETGALAKTASGALERQPYLRVVNLADAMTDLKAMGYLLFGLDGTADTTLAEALQDAGSRPVGLVLGAEGPGLREKTKDTCDRLVRIPFAGAFGSLNVSNAAAVALYAASQR